MLHALPSYRAMRPLGRALFALGILACLPRPAAAQWLQWGGPDRNFIARADKLADSWPDDGPKQLWKRPLGEGYSSILVDGERLYTMYRVKNDEYVICLSAKDGKTIWEYHFESPPGEGMKQFGPGPHSTPLIVGDRVFAVGVNADLFCLNKQDGKVAWSHAMSAEYEAEIPGRGYSCSPIAYHDTVIVSAGGKADQAFFAFKQADGKVAWKAGDYDVGHSSPILISRAGHDELVWFVGKAVVGVDPSDGKELWTTPFKTQFGANISTPVWCGNDILFCSAGYKSGSRGIRLKSDGGKTSAEELWYQDKMGIHFGNAICIDGRVYGSHGDFGPAFLTAIDAKSGEIAWRDRAFAKSSGVYGDGKLILIDENGQLGLCRLLPDKLEVLSKVEMLEHPAWTAPTLVGSTLYLRDRNTIMALDVGKPKS